MSKASRKADSMNDIEGIEDGDFPETPEDFDIDTATLEQLASYGLPRRPDERSDAKQFALWRTLCPPGVRTVTPSVRRIGAVSPRDLEGSPEWAGGVIRPDSGKSFAGVGTSFHVPPITELTNSNALIWVGLDGGSDASNSASIIRVGVSVAVLNGEVIYRGFYGWTNPVDTYEFENLPIAAGDLVGINLGVGPGANRHLAENEATIFFACSGHPRVAKTLPAPPGVTFIGDTAEWVVERPMINGSLAELPKFGSVTLKGGASGPLSEPLEYYDFANTQNADIISMVEGSPPTLLAVATLVADNAVEVERR